MKQHSNALTEGPIARSLIAFTIPILLGNVLQSLNGSVNAIWVGRFLGEAALSATAIANSVLFLLLGGVFGISMAATILIAQYVGAQNMEAARRVVGASGTFFALIATVIASAGFIWVTPLLVAMHAPIQAIPLARDYLRILFIAIPFLYIYTYVMAVLRGAGDSKTPLKFLVLSVCLDIVLNPLLIFGAGPIPKLGIAGSALATLIANAVSLGALLTYLYRSRHPLCLRGNELSYLKFDTAIVATLLKKGLPMGLHLVLISANAVAVISLVNRFGTDTTAAYGAVWQLWNYLQMPAFAIGAAVSSLAAQNVGAQRWDRVSRIAHTGLLSHLVLTGTLVLILLLLNRQALSLFLAPGAALSIADHINQTSAWSFIFYGIAMVLYGVVRSTGAVIVPVVALAISLWGVRLPCAALLMPLYEADAIWWSFPISALVSATLAVTYYYFGNWRSAHMLPATN